MCLDFFDLDTVFPFFLKIKEELKVKNKKKKTLHFDVFH